MGWYSAVGKPIFFALPPEAAHRVAGALLGLPLPWERIGTGGSPIFQPTVMAGVPVANPIGLAAGFDKSCAHLDALGRLGFGYVVGGTITRRSRSGHPSPRIKRYPSRSSMVNAMGLPNPGAAAAARNLGGSARTAPRFVSVADEDRTDVASTVDLLADLVDGIELNASCPNVSWGRDRDDEEHLKLLVETILSRSSLPLFVKLPPFVHPKEREAVMGMVQVAMSAGASGITCSNTRPVIDRSLSVGRGGLSGRALWEHTTRIVSELRTEMGGPAVINACGGIFEAGDVQACLEAGATTVQIYTALIFRGPGVVREMLEPGRAALSAEA